MFAAYISMLRDIGTLFPFYGRTRQCYHSFKPFSHVIEEVAQFQAFATLAFSSILRLPEHSDVLGSTVIHASKLKLQCNEIFKTLQSFSQAKKY